MVENGEARGARENPGNFVRGDVVVRCELDGETLAVSVTAGQTPVRRVRLRWRFRERLVGRVLGDAWERAYGDLE